MGSRRGCTFDIASALIGLKGIDKVAKLTKVGEVAQTRWAARRDRADRYEQAHRHEAELNELRNAGTIRIVVHLPE